MLILKKEKTFSLLTEKYSVFKYPDLFLDVYVYIILLVTLFKLMSSLGSASYMHVFTF